jgi:NADPH:quinone reductase-like Zn-dependent oxidoreductase
MKAVRIHEYGSPEVLRYEDAPRPSLQAGDVLVRVHAAGINPVDWKIRDGSMRAHLRYTLPLILGWDVSGVVETVGPGVDEASWLRVGDEVFARTDIARDGSYAEYMAVRASELSKKPKSIDHVHAAAVPLAALTAWQALVSAPEPYVSASLRQGQTVLIHGASGGVGSFAVQIAKLRGAHVIATTSARNVDLVRELGADRVIDYTAERFEDVVHDVDAVIDTVGGDTQERSWRVLARGGVLVSIVNPPPEEMAGKYGVRAGFLFLQPLAWQLDEIARAIDEGKIRPIVSEVLPLSDARRGQELSQGGHVRGKIVLRVC